MSKITYEIPNECEFCKEPPVCLCKHNTLFMVYRRWLCEKHKKKFLNTGIPLNRLGYEFYEK
jgi:hypothetical protein